MRKESICVTAPEQPKSVLSELIVAAGKCGCELVVPDPEDITFLEAEKFARQGGLRRILPCRWLFWAVMRRAALPWLWSFRWRCAARALILPTMPFWKVWLRWRTGSSIRVISQRPLIILDACRTPQQAAALLRVLNMAKVRHMSAIIGLAEEEGAEASSPRWRPA